MQQQFQQIILQNAASLMNKTCHTIESHVYDNV